MRRGVIPAILLFLTTASCYYAPGMIGERQSTLRPSVAPTPCRVVARTKCASEQCRGGNMDLVTYQCAGSKQTRCVANFRCSAD